MSNSNKTVSNSNPAVAQPAGPRRITMKSVRKKSSMTEIEKGDRIVYGVKKGEVTSVYNDGKASLHFDDGTWKLLNMEELDLIE
jgi:hypothetical protein